MKQNASGVLVDLEYGMTTVDFNNTEYKDKPLIIATHFTQVFYVQNISRKPKKNITKKCSAK
jgi:tagatose-1,6-bisphosphate aldolase